MKIIFVLLISFMWLMTMILFFTQFCQKDDDPEVCGHKNLHVLFEVDQICAFCKAKYVVSKEKEDWLHIICVNNGFSSDASRNNILL